MLIFEDSKNPQPRLLNIIGSLIAIATNSRNLLSGNIASKIQAGDVLMPKNVEKETAELYDDCWVNFSRKQYDEATQLLRERLKNNQINFGLIKDKIVLDGGCGGGRYSVALSRIGANQVIGIDIGEKSISFANKMAKKLGLQSKLKFKVGNVLSLPFKDNTFDFVFSNGVIHHTMDIEKGLSEISRVLKPNGYAWIFVQGGGGYRWLIIDAYRRILRGVPREIVQELMILSGISSNRIFQMLDNLYAPIQNWQNSKSFEKLLIKHGLADFKRLTRGAYSKGIYPDNTERIFNKESFAREKYGIDALRYLSKKVSH